MARPRPPTSALALGILLAVGAASTGRARAADDDRRDARVARLVAAVAGTADAVVRTAVDDLGGDPVLAAAELLWRQAARGPEAGADRAGGRAGAARVAAAHAGVPRADGLAGLVARWDGWERGALERETAWAARARGLGGASAPVAAAELAAWREASDSPAAVAALGAHAIAVRRSGGARAAVLALRDAVAAADRLPWPVRACTLRAELGQALLLVDAYEEALAVGDDGLARARALTLPKTAAIFQRARAGALRGLGRLDDALVAVEDAYAGRESAPPASVLVQHAGILSALGRRTDALALGARALAIAEAGGKAIEVASVLNSLAAFEAAEGRLARAITYSERARDLLAPLELNDEVRRVRATTLHNFGVAERDLGRRERSLAMLADAERDRRAIGLHEAADRSAHHRGRALADLGRLAEAADLLRSLAEAATERRRPGAAALARRWLADVEARRGHPTEALRVLEEALARAEADRAPESAIDELEASLAQLRNDVRPARERLEARMAARAGRMSPAAVGRAQSARGQLLRREGRLDEASAALRSALDSLRRRAGGLDDADLSLGAPVEGDVGRALAVALERHARAQDPAARRAALEDALHASESGRAVLLADGLANRDALVAARVPADVGRTYREARHGLEVARRRVASLPSDAPAADVEAARAALEAADARATAATARVRRELRFGGEVTAPEPIDLVTVERLLGPRCAYVAYEASEGRLVALVVTADGADLVSLGDARVAEGRAAAWLDRLASGADDRELAASVYDALLRPIESMVHGATRLLVAPDPAHARLPFAALLRRGEDGAGTRVVERWETAFVPSASTWAALRDEAGRTPPGLGVVAVGDPGGVASGGLPALPASADEAARVAAVYPETSRVVLRGAAATREALLAALGARRAAAFHFAGHAEMDPDRPRLSALVLAGGDRLEADEVTEAGLVADLAVLSACATGVTAHLRGEGPVGFPRRLFLAGCPRVVVTAWPIADGGAADLVERFHAGRVGDGLGVAAALRAAQRASAAAGSPPTKWAAFLLWGLPD